MGEMRERQKGTKGVKGVKIEQKGTRVSNAGERGGSKEGERMKMKT
jgi:hypothetical protein